MTALTTDDIEDALMLHVAGGLCTEASGQPFNASACAEAAKAFKHNAFARLLDHRKRAADNLAAALLSAATVLENALSSSKSALQLIRGLTFKTRPVLVEDGAESKPSVLINKSKITTRHAATIVAAWTVKNEILALVHSVCVSIPASSELSVVAEAITAALHGAIKPAAHRLELALAAAEACRPDSAPPAKRPRCAPSAAPNG